MLDESLSKKVATKGDLRETELRLQKEIEVVRREIEVVKSDLTLKIETVRAEMRVGLEKCHTEIEKCHTAIERSRNTMIALMLTIGLGLAGLIVKVMH